MFLAIREITTARGRFALIGGTVALITLARISWVVVFKGQKLWVYGLHAMFAFLLVFGVARAYVDGRLDARVIGLAIALAVV